MLPKIYSHAPSKEYDEGWERVFGKKELEETESDKGKEVANDESK